MSIIKSFPANIFFRIKNIKLNSILIFCLNTDFQNFGRARIIPEVVQVNRRAEGRHVIQYKHSFYYFENCLKPFLRIKKLQLFINLIFCIEIYIHIWDKRLVKKKKPDKKIENDDNNALRSIWLLSRSENELLLK